MIESVLQSLMSGLPVLVMHFAVTVVMLIVGIRVYTRITPLDEFRGYPRGRPGEVWSTLLGRRRMRISGRYRTNEPIVAWAERRRRPSNLKNLGGLSGGPTLDGAGRVVGVLVAESRRRGRVYTTAPISMTQILSGGFVETTSEKVMSLSPRNLKPRAELLRQEPSIAKVVCLAGSGESRRG